MFWIVRADRFWYKFEFKEDAEKHYNYIFNNKDEKYKNIEKLYLAEYDRDKMPKILKMWTRPQQEEEFGYGR